MRQLLVVLDQVANVDITIVFLQQCILAQLISIRPILAWTASDHGRHNGPVNEGIVKSEFQEESLELLLHLNICFPGLLVGVDVERGHSSAIHFEYRVWSNPSQE